MQKENFPSTVKAEGNVDLIISAVGFTRVLL